MRPMDTVCELQWLLKIYIVSQKSDIDNLFNKNIDIF